MKKKKKILIIVISIVMLGLSLFFFQQKPVKVYWCDHCYKTTTCPIGKKIIFPIDSFIQYNSYEYKNSGTFKIVLLLEASCPDCIKEIYQLDSYLQQRNIAKTQFVVILTGQDSEFTRYHIKEINSFGFPILYDPEDKFIKKNKLGILKFNNCVLIGPDSEIKGCGSPHLEHVVEKEYKKIIKNYLK